MNTPQPNQLKICVKAAEILPTKLLSPLYTAVIEYVPGKRPALQLACPLFTVGVPPEQRIGNGHGVDPPHVGVRNPAKNCTVPVALKGKKIGRASCRERA